MRSSHGIFDKDVGNYSRCKLLQRIWKVFGRSTSTRPATLRIFPSNISPFRYWSRTRKMETTLPTLIPFINSALCLGRRPVKMSATCKICPEMKLIRLSIDIQHSPQLQIEVLYQSFLSCISPSGRAAAESELVRPETHTQRQTGKRRRRQVNT